MAFEAFPPQYPPVDVELVDRIVCKLKAQGIFDQFRKDCLADVDTKPAYQNLQQRVNGTVATFLATQTWQQDLNKTQLRESLRRHVQQGFLEVGVDRIVDQVVNPKVFTIFMPKVEDVVYDCLGIEKPKQPPPSDNSLGARKMNIADLLPKDLDPVSPESGNLSFDEDETKDEANNESVSKMDISQDSQVSGISDLSSHMGDSAKENNFDSNTIKSEVTAVKENSSEIHFENFENLSEKIKQTETGHNPIVNSLPDVTDGIDSKPVLNIEENNTPKSNGNKEEVLMEIDSVSNSTFDDNAFAIKIRKEETPIRMMSEDSLSSSSFNAKLKKEKPRGLILENSTNSLDKSEASTLCKESSSDKEIKVPLTLEDSEVKNEETAIEKKERKKVDDVRDKKHRDSSSSSSKTSKSNYDKHRSSESKQRYSNESKEGKEKAIKEERERDKEKTSREEKEKSTKHKDDRHSSSKDRHKEKDKIYERNRDKEIDKKKDKADDRDGLEKEKRIEKEAEKDKSNRGKEKNDKERPRTDKESHRHEREKYRLEKHEKEKEKNDNEKDRHDREKDRHEKSKRDKEKCEKEKKDREKEKGKFDKDKERERSDREKERSKERGKVKSDKENKNEKDKEVSRSVEEKSKDDKKKEPRKYEKQSSSSKKNDNCKSDVKDKNKQNEESTKEKYSSSKSGKSEDDKRERKRKAERCIDEIKLKEARRSWDRDSGGGNSKGQGPSKSSTNDYKSSSSSSTAKGNRTGESSNQHKTSERNLEPKNELEEPSDVDTILMKINSSIEESQNIQSQDELSVKKPKIAKNIFEIRKIMQARKNLARQMQSDKKKKESCDTVQKPDAADSPSTTEPSPHDKGKIGEENKENIKTGQMDTMKSCKVSHTKGKFTGFLESDIEKSRNTLLSFQTAFHAFCKNIGLDIETVDSLESIDYCRVFPNEEVLDDNLNKVKPRPLRSERRNTYPHDNQVNKAVENIMSGKNGCYVLLKDCNEVVEAMRCSSQVIQQGEDQTGSSASKQKPKQESDKNIISEVIDVEHSSSKTQETSTKRKYSSSSATFSTPHSHVRECVDLESPSNYSISSQQSLKQQNISSKKGTCNRSAKQQPKQEQKEDEPSSPDPPISVVLNDYLNDTVLNVTEAPATVPLTEAMLDSLMRESSMIIEDEGFEDSDDSDFETSRQVKSYEKTMDLSEQLVKQEFISNEWSIATSDQSFCDNKMEFSEADSIKSPRNSDVDPSGCDISHPDKGFPESGCENKLMKRRNQRVCRSTSQRYDNNDLYKPRPVLPQNSKRVRAPRSESSEEFSLRGQFESSPPKRSR